MDSFLITLVVVAIAALSNWLQHRAQAREEAPPELDPHSPPHPHPRPLHRGTVPPAQRPAAPGPVAPETSLEETLRRLLGGERPIPPMPPRPRTPRNLTKGLAPPMHRPDLAPQIEPVRSLPPTPPQPPPAPQPALAQSSEAKSAYERVQHLSESVAKRLQDVGLNLRDHSEAHQVPHRRAPAPRSPIFAIRRNPDAARQAFIASLVFGTPKGLEN